MKQKWTTMAIAELVGDDLDDPVATLQALEILADLKYNQYQQFQPGLQFMESLIQWLDRMAPEHRAKALRFVRTRLVFFGREEMYHFTKMTYRHRIRPQLVKWETDAKSAPIHERSKTSQSEWFKAEERRCLYLGLSDGAHIDDFRRNGQLSNEQVVPTYKIGTDMLQGMTKKLRADFTKQRFKARMDKEGSAIPNHTFRRVFLIDDFTASGTSFLREKKNDGGKSVLKGRLVSFCDEVFDKKENAAFFDPDCSVHMVFYVSTTRAQEAIGKLLTRYNKERKEDKKREIQTSIITCQTIDATVALDPNGKDAEFKDWVESHDVACTWDESMAEGGEEGHQVWGFAGCGLPVVLAHNCPNNSIGALWTYPAPDCKAPGLFPRIRRHRHED